MNALSRALVAVIVVPIKLYQRFISPMRPPTCRFFPSCSAYAVQALQIHGPFVGSWLAARRLGRCHPWTPGGVDHVPPRGRWRSTRPPYDPGEDNPGEANSSEANREAGPNSVPPKPPTSEATQRKRAGHDNDEGAEDPAEGNGAEGSGETSTATRSRTSAMRASSLTSAARRRSWRTPLVVALTRDASPRTTHLPGA